MHFPFKPIANATEAHTFLSTLVNVVCNNCIDDFFRYSGDYADCYFSVKENKATLIATSNAFNETEFLSRLDRHFNDLLINSLVEQSAVGRESPYPWSCGVAGHGVTCDILYFKGTLKIKFEARHDTKEAK